MLGSHTWKYNLKTGIYDKFLNCILFEQSPAKSLFAKPLILCYGYKLQNHRLYTKLNVTKT